ncbi:hypothetical protein PG991_003523 [Apiospora marii]|uniref:Uncharacterized protein n=1 Tax=Apiospora marii TaxID=335849 RepID=A0ABR1S3P9_9PEZI
MFWRNARSRRPRQGLEPPDFVSPVFEQTDLDFYNAESHRSEVADFIDYFSTVTNRTIRRHAPGFDDDDIWFFQRQKQQRFPDTAYNDPFLQPSEANPGEWYEIGIAYKNRHAMIIISTITKDEYVTTDTYFQNAFQDPVPRHLDGNFRIIHIRFERDTDGPERPIELAFDTPTGPRDVDRYSPLYHIRTTDRLLKYIGLRSCPPHHAEMLSDCATYAHNFLTQLLDYLLWKNFIPEAEHREILRYLVRHIHVTEGATGQTEYRSREDDQLGQSAAVALEHCARHSPNREHRNRPH